MRKIICLSFATGRSVVIETNLESNKIEIENHTRKIRDSKKRVISVETKEVSLETYGNQWKASIRKRKDTPTPTREVPVKTNLSNTDIQFEDMEQRLKTLENDLNSNLTRKPTDTSKEFGHKDSKSYGENGNRENNRKPTELLLSIPAGAILT